MFDINCVNRLSNLTTDELVVARANYGYADESFLSSTFCTWADQDRDRAIYTVRVEHEGEIMNWALAVWVDVDTLVADYVF